MYVCVYLPANCIVCDYGLCIFRVDLEVEHYGMEKLKKRILEFLAVRQLKNKMKGVIQTLCLACVTTSVHNVLTYFAYTHNTTHTHTYTHTYTHMQAHTHAYISINTHVHTYMYTHILIHK